MNRFDDIFRDNVEKAFSSYNADHLAEEGWNSFVAGKAKRRRRTIWFPLWARAASVMLVIGLGVFIAYKASIRHSAPEILSGPGSSSNLPAESPAEDKTPEPSSASAARPSISGTTPVQDKTEKSPAWQQNSYEEKYSPSEFILTGAEPLPLPEISLDRFINRYGSPPPHVLAENELPEDKIPEDPVSAAVMPEGFVMDKNSSGGEKRHGTGILMAGVSGLLAQSAGTASPSSGLSVGFYLDQKLSGKISVRPGLAIAMQSFGTGDVSSQDRFNYTMSLNDGTKGIPHSSSGHLSMLAMEVPLNIVFRISGKERSGFYLSTGASTMIYLSQQFRAGYVNKYTKSEINTMTGESFSETRYSTVEVENNYSAFSHTDFFGLANLSAGYSFAYGKTGTMLVEPFLQLPVSDLTSLNLRVRYGGISMKLKFGRQERDN
ncbi:MAG TPA: hypothetical protein PKL65_06175 [Bacteroidales bacterium]|mgnify:CR=1 FL=1|jgi:hypothetical protein|nr:hypothetical protein [Bacteroidales bacterium]HNR41799.1 hypothetical protein [Bacteroidales bacterium]HPM18622.1 hypothetical protein [Bacteroidales bacterium]HQG76093.1 hypothetical protein [Bacteroidales bacterium]